MKPTVFFILALFVASGTVTASSLDHVLSVASLLAEFCDRDAVTYFSPELRNRLWSSYDRRSVASDRDGWFANDDGEKRWWGEGDEQIYVDGESFPSFFGTGTEDFFGYAWSRGDRFVHPLLAQPQGAGATAVGEVVNIRERILDAVPFSKSLRFDLELWHWGDTAIDFDSLVFAYLR